TLKEGLSDAEVSRSKNKIQTGTVIQGELPIGRMRTLAGRWIYNHEYRTLEEDLDRLDSITRNDLQAVAEKSKFAPLTITTLGPGAV
ncbi:MAG: hypothetical protein WCI73_02925, partial [Phycisphaerae bacterium]